ncbi:MAG TPA: phospholipase D-like domain-containing protein [Myxococcales bacterium]|nr:phospholipase D-like domain-containing protein [Myxococcales bacterium]
MKKPGPSVWLEPLKTSEGVAASFVVKVAGLPVGKKMTLDFFEVEPPGKQRDEKRAQKNGDVQLGSVAGRVAPLPLATKLSGIPTFTFVPDKPPPPPPQIEDAVEFRFLGSDERFQFALPTEALDADEGDFWELQVRARAPKIVSPVLTIAHVRHSLVAAFPYRWHDGHELHLYHDAAEDKDGNAGAFADLLQAIDKAEKFIFAVDWSFQPFVKFNLGSSDLNGTIGAALMKKANAGVTVAIHTWNHTTYFATDDQNDDADDWFKDLAGELKLGGVPKKLLWHASSPDRVSLSHHQKFVVLDQPGKNNKKTFRAFFGGLDLTKGRLDWGEHPASALDSRVTPRKTDWGTKKRKTNEWYNGETGDDKSLPREPWHDIYGWVDGPVAWDFVREFVVRWAADLPTQLGHKLQRSGDPVNEVWKMVRDDKNWVQQLDPHQGPWTAQLLRSNTSQRCTVAAEFGEDDAKPLKQALPSGTEASIRAMYEQAIDHAENFIYIENQYVIGSGARWGRDTIANDIPERIVNKIVSKAERNQPFHVYLVMPMFPEGDPTSMGGLDVRNYEWRTLQYMTTTLQKKLKGTPWTDYLTLLFLADWHPVQNEDWKKKEWLKKNRNERLKAHQRYMVYVHSKFMIVDDRFVLLGSANLNERSLAGNRDTEIACALWPVRNQEKTCMSELRKFRKELFVEHFGKPQGSSDYDDPASTTCRDACQGVADDNYLAFRTLNAGPKGNACRLPITVVRGQANIGSPENLGKVPPATPEPFDFIPDSDGDDDLWRWTCRGARFWTGSAPE